MIDIYKVRGIASCGEISKTIVMSPTKEGQVATAAKFGGDDGIYVYSPSDLPFPSTQSLAGNQALIVSKNSTADRVFYDYTETIVEDEAITAALKMSSCVLSIEPPGVTFNGMSFTTPRMRVMFAATGPRSFETFSEHTLAAPQDQSGGGALDSEFYVYGSSGDRVTVANAEQIDNPTTIPLYVGTTNGQEIVSMRPVYPYYPRFQERNLFKGAMYGLRARGFSFVLDAASGKVRNGGTATAGCGRVIGYNINPAEPNDEDRNVLWYDSVLLGNTIDAVYYSFDEAKIQKSMPSWTGEYRIDSPANKTSSSFTGKAILLVFASLQKNKYLVLAPQKGYSNLNEAKNDVSKYVATCTKPDGLELCYALAAAIIIDDHITTNVNTTFFCIPAGSFALGGSGSGGAQILPSIENVPLGYALSPAKGVYVPVELPNLPISAGNQDGLALVSEANVMLYDDFPAFTDGFTLRGGLLADKSKDGYVIVNIEKIANNGVGQNHRITQIGGKYFDGRDLDVTVNLLAFSNSMFSLIFSIRELYYYLYDGYIFMDRSEISPNLIIGKRGTLGRQSIGGSPTTNYEVGLVFGATNFITNQSGVFAEPKTGIFFFIHTPPSP